MIRHINDSHIRQFREDIKAETWENVIDIHDPNESYSTFMKTFTDKYNKHFPLRPVKATKVILNHYPRYREIFSKKR